MNVFKRILLVSCFLWICTACSGGGIEFSDSNLKRAIEFKLGVTDPDESDLQSLTELDASSSGIRTLQGIEYAVNLQELDLSMNKIADLEPLEGLSELTELNLWMNRITDIGPLLNLKKLESLGLALNQNLRDISALSGLVNLKNISITSSNVKDISPLSNLVNLESLTLNDRRIRKVSFLKEFPKLKEINGSDVEEYFERKSNISVEQIVFLSVIGFFVFLYFSILVFRKVKRLKVRPFWSFFQIFKWIFICLLAILLVGGLWFQAPWKVLVLVAVILYCCTFLPRRFRKWAWVGFACVAGGVTVWVFLPENDEGWEIYSVEDQVKAFNDKRHIDDDENAAVIYGQLIGDKDHDLFSSDLRPEFLDDSADEKTMKDFWKDEDHPMLADWMRQYDDDLKILIAASTIEMCRFPSKASIFIDNRYSLLKDYSTLLIRQGNNDIGNGDVDAGLQKYRACLQLGDHIMQQSTIIDVLIGIAIQRQVFPRYCDYIINRNPGEKELKYIEEAISNVEFDWQKQWPDILELEKLSFKSIFLMCYSKNEQGAIRFSRGLDKEIQKQVPESFVLEDEKQSSFLHQKLEKLGIMVAWFYFPSTPEKASRIIDEVYDKTYDTADPNYNRQTDHQSGRFGDIELNYKCMLEHLVPMLKKSLITTGNLYEMSLSWQQGCLLVAELRRFKDGEGDWPESLDELGVEDLDVLVDPVSGEQFRYEKNEESFRLYGIGRNGVDDDGERDGGSNDDRRDDVLIWPQEKCN